MRNSIVKVPLFDLQSCLPLSKASALKRSRGFWHMEKASLGGFAAKKAAHKKREAGIPGDAGLSFYIVSSNGA